MKKIFVLILVLCVAALFQGCKKVASPKKVRIVFIGNTSDNFWSIMQLGCEFAAEQVNDVDLNFRYLENGTPAGQRELLKALDRNNVDGIAVDPIDPESETDFLNQIATHTLLVCVNSDAPKSQRKCYIGTDNVAAGKQVAQLLKAALPQGGKIVLFAAYANSQDTKDRILGITNGLADSNIQIIGTLLDGAARDIAQKNAEDALAKYPDLAGMACLNGYQGPAILTAVREAHKAGKVKIVCFENSSQTLSGIGSGDIYGTVVQNALRIGTETIYSMEAFLHGDKTQFAGGKILIPSQVITKTNLESYKILLNSELLQSHAGKF